MTGWRLRLRTKGETTVPKVKAELSASNARLSLMLLEWCFGIPTCEGENWPGDGRGEGSVSGCRWWSNSSRFRLSLAGRRVLASSFQDGRVITEEARI